MVVVHPNLENLLDRAAEYLARADRVIVSAGGGLSLDAGLDYADTLHFRRRHPCLQGNLDPAASSLGGTLIPSPTFRPAQFGRDVLSAYRPGEHEHSSLEVVSRREAAADVNEVAQMLHADQPLLWGFYAREMHYLLREFLNPYFNYGEWTEDSPEPGRFSKTWEDRMAEAKLRAIPSTLSLRILRESGDVVRRQQWTVNPRPIGKDAAGKIKTARSSSMAIAAAERIMDSASKAGATTSATFGLDESGKSSPAPGRATATSNAVEQHERAEDYERPRTVDKAVFATSSHTGRVKVRDEHLAKLIAEVEATTSPGGRRYHRAMSPRDKMRNSALPKQSSVERFGLPRYLAVSSVYSDLATLLEHKNYFVVTTNTDEIFRRTGLFDPHKVYTMHGSFRMLQCLREPGAADHGTAEGGEGRGCRHVWPFEEGLDLLLPHVNWLEGKVSTNHDFVRKVEGSWRQLRHGFEIHRKPAGDGKNNCTTAPVVHHSTNMIASATILDDSEYAASSPTSPVSTGADMSSKVKFPAPVTNENSRDPFGRSDYVDYDVDWNCFLPRCPKCGRTGSVVPNTHAACGQNGHYFVREPWQGDRDNFEDFVSEGIDAFENIVILELGAGHKGSGLTGLRVPMEKLALDKTKRRRHIRKFPRTPSCQRLGGGGGSPQHSPVSSPKSTSTNLRLPPLQELRKKNSQQAGVVLTENRTEADDLQVKPSSLDVASPAAASNNIKANRVSPQEKLSGTGGNEDHLVSSVTPKNQRAEVIHPFTPKSKFIAHGTRTRTLKTSLSRSSSPIVSADTQHEVTCETVPGCDIRLIRVSPGEHWDVPEDDGRHIPLPLRCQDALPELIKRMKKSPYYHH